MHHIRSTWGCQEACGSDKCGYPRHMRGSRTLSGYGHTAVRWRVTASLSREKCQHRTVECGGAFPHGIMARVGEDDDVNPWQLLGERTAHAGHNLPFRRQW